MRRFFMMLATLACLGLLACGESEEEKQTNRLSARFRAQQYNELPSDWKTLTKRAIAEKLKDPNSAQLNYLGTPLKTHVDGVEKWLVGVDVNAKNDFGGYTGFRVWTIAIRNGEVEAVEVMPEDAAKLYRKMQNS